MKLIGTALACAALAFGQPALATDCNGNGVPDDEDIANGTSMDCNANGIPDECDITALALFQDFDGSELPPGVTGSISGAAHTTTNCSPAGACGQGSFLYIGHDGPCTYGMTPSWGIYTLHGVTIPADPSHAKLVYCSEHGSECCDFGTVRIGNQQLDYVCCPGDGLWEQRQVNLAAWAGQTVDLEFRFSAPFGPDDYYGWAIDNIRIGQVGTGAQDCDGNGVLDECEIADDPSLDQDQNGVLDGCEGLTSTYCVSEPNSVSQGSYIGYWGTTSISQDMFTVRAGWCPAGTWGLFFYGPEEIQLPFGEGWRCIGPGSIGIFRLWPAEQTDGAGTARRRLHFDQPPEGSGPGQITPGSTWNFQWWYRDPPGGPAGFNLSNALRATFVP